MIPRTKVNYLMIHLLKAMGISDEKTRFRDLLQKKICDFMRTENILLMPSGRYGLYCILKAIPRMKVIIPAYTCKAVAEAAILAGKDIVYVDAEENGFNVDIAGLKDVMDDNSIFIATHQFGFPCRISDIIELAEVKKTIVIEDAAASLGSRVQNKLTGTYGKAAFFSFDSTKLINIPMKGGFVISEDKQILKEIERICHDELLPMPAVHKYKLLIMAMMLIVIENPLIYRIFHTLYFELRGKFTEDSSNLDLQKGPFYSYEMAEWQAFIALDQMDNIHQIIEKRRTLYASYLKELSGLFSFDLPPVDIKGEWACIRFPIRIKGDKMAFYRKAVKRGVDFAFSFTYPPCPANYDNARMLAESVLDLPYYNKLNVQEQRKVIHVLRSIDQI